MPWQRSGDETNFHILNIVNYLKIRIIELWLECEGRKCEKSTFEKLKYKSGFKDLMLKAQNE